jgi:hypothetical protein
VLLAVSREWRCYLFGADGENLFALDFYFDAEGRTDVGALNDGALDPDVAGKVGGLQRVIERAAARIADERMRCVMVVVIFDQLVHIGDVLELAITVRGFSREGPISLGGIGGARGDTNQGGRHVFPCDGTANEEVLRSPGLREIRNVADGGVVLVGVRQKRIGIGRRRRHFDLRRRFDFRRLCESSSAREPMRCKEKNDTQKQHADNERQQGIAVTHLCRRSDARNGGHVRLEARRR